LWLAALAVILIIGIYHHAALFLPESLIDDATDLSNSERFWRNLRAGDIASLIREDRSVFAHLHNPGFSLFTAIAYGLAGDNPSPLHAFRLVLLAAVCSILVALPRVVMADLPSRAWFSAPLGGLAAALFFATAEVPGWHDMQTIQANWYRLHTTDVLPSVCAAFQILFLYMAPRGLRWKRRLAEMLSAAFLCAAITIKVTALAYVAALAAGALLLLLAHDPRRGSWCRVCAYVLGFCAVYFPLLLLTRKIESPAAYGDSYNFTLEQIHLSYLNWKEMYWCTFGPIAVTVVVGAAVRVTSTWFTRRDWRHFLSVNAVVFHLWLAWLLATVAYFPWKYNLPRYMLPGLLPVCAAAGLEIASQIEWARGRPHRRLWMWFAAGICAILLLPVRLLVGLELLIALVRSRTSGIPRFAAFNFGALAVGCIYFAIAGWISNRALQADYVACEHLQAEVTAEARRLIAEGAPVSFLADGPCEQIGSFLYFLKKHEGIDTDVPIVASEEQAKEQASLVYIEKLCTTAPLSLTAAPSDWVKFSEPTSTRVPIDFWQWRRNLWQRHPTPPWTTVTLPTTVAIRAFDN
jgi:hypothetical protein